jgi:hypothetical protein
VGVIEVEVPEGIPLKPLKKKIDELVKEEKARWVLFERAKEEINSVKKSWKIWRRYGRVHGEKRRRGWTCSRH